MTNNVIRVDFGPPSESTRLTVPWETVRDFVYSFGYDPDNTEDLYEFIYQAFNIIVEDDEQ